MELLCSEPFFLVDGAHNSCGIKALRDSLCRLWPDEKFCFIMGVMADKDYEKMVDLLLPLATDFITITPESSRALQADALAEYIKKQGVLARSLEHVDDIFLIPESGRKTVAFGSLYFVGELEAVVQKRCREDELWHIFMNQKREDKEKTI